MKNERKTHEELANLKNTIRQDVEQKLRTPDTATDFTASFEVEDPSSGGRRIVRDPAVGAPSGNDDFWNLGRPKPRVYKKPDFSDEDGSRASELETEFGELGGYEAEGYT